MRWIPAKTAVLLGVAVLLLGAAPAAAEDEASPPAAACDVARARSAAAAIQARYDAVDHLAADFVQSTQSVVLGMAALAGEEDTATVTGGRVLFSKPGRMRWAYREPEESYVISNGKIMWIYDVAARQATRLPVGEEVLAGAALQFLLGEGRLSESFEISASACEGDRIVLDLRPLAPASYERLGLTADPATGLIAETSIVDLFGNRTRIRFENLEPDRSPPDGAFEFTPPADVEVIDMLPPG